SYSSDPGYSRDYSSYSYSSYSSYDDDDDDDYDEDDEEDEDEEEKDDDSDVKNYIYDVYYADYYSDEEKLKLLKEWGDMHLRWAVTRFAYATPYTESWCSEELFAAGDNVREAVKAYEYALKIDKDSESLKTDAEKANHVRFFVEAKAYKYTKRTPEECRAAYENFKNNLTPEIIAEAAQNGTLPQGSTYYKELLRLASIFEKSEVTSMVYTVYRDIVLYIEQLRPEKIEAEKVSVLSGLNNILRVYDNDEQISPEESARVRELISRIDPEYFTRTAREEAAKNRAETAENCMWCCGCLVFFIICFLICLVGCI
ncbi:MAG: hypothetical protein J6332_00120, partial [Abditibacteriota bacterium]|nr:hypothetical protein [Abditibacteriota bacterium]